MKYNFVLEQWEKKTAVEKSRALNRSLNDETIIVSYNFMEDNRCLLHSFFKITGESEDTLPEDVIVHFYCKYISFKKIAKIKFSNYLYLNYSWFILHEFPEIPIVNFYVSRVNHRLNGINRKTIHESWN